MIRSGKALRVGGARGIIQYEKGGGSSIGHGTSVTDRDDLTDSTLPDR